LRTAAEAPCGMREDMSDSDEIIILFKFGGAASAY
jgi:hypothetical protein